MNVIILNTTRGGNKLRVNGFTYRIQERRTTSIKWKCDEGNCNERLKTNLKMANAVEMGIHRHDPHEPNVIEAQQLRIAMTAQINMRPHVSAGQIHREATLNADPNVVAHLTSGPSIKRSLRRTKCKNRPPLPLTAEQLVINHNYSHTRNNQLFLIKDEIFEGDRMLIFASNFLLTLLFAAGAGTVFMDGTFQMVPAIFLQLFMLNIFYSGKKQIPVVYVLLKRKRTSTYRRVFVILRELAAQQDKIFNPDSVLIDFEVGLIQAI